MLQFVHSIDSFPRQYLRRGLVNQVVTTLNSIVHVPLPMIFFLVAKRGGHTSLRCACMGACGIDFAEHCNTGIRKLHCGHQPGATCADDHHIEFIIHISILNYSGPSFYAIGTETPNNRMECYQCNRTAEKRPTLRYLRQIAM